MSESDDALVGLRFEVSGGLSRMSGRILGKAAGLYLVRRDGAAHLELLSLDDLRPAKFFDDLPVEKTPAAIPAAREPAEPPAPATRRRLADQIRKKLGAG